MLDKNQKYDNNGEPCSLLIVHCGMKDINFSNTASKVAQIDKESEYWITMKQGARYIELKKEGNGNYKEHYSSALKIGSVYEMSLVGYFSKARSLKTSDCPQVIRLFGKLEKLQPSEDPDARENSEVI